MIMEPPSFNNGRPFLHREQCSLYINIEKFVKMLFGDVAKRVRDFGQTRRWPE